VIPPSLIAREAARRATQLGARHQLGALHQLGARQKQGARRFLADRRGAAPGDIA